MDNGESSYRRFLDGDESGMVEIVKDYRDGLILYLKGMVGHIGIAEELAEDAFVKLVVKKPSFSGKCAFKTWLYAIARNGAMDYFRHRAKTATVSIEDIPAGCGDEESLESRYIREERKRLLYRALKKLSPAYGQVLYLLYLEGFDNAQAAAVMKKSKRQIENLVYRAKLALRTELEKEGFHHEDL